MARREFLTRLAQMAALPFVADAAPLAAQTPRKSLKIMMKSARGLRRSHQGRAPVLAWTCAYGIWLPVGETLDKLAAKHVTISACGACSRARGVTDADLSNYGTKFGNPTIFVSLVEWADHLITE